VTTQRARRVESERGSARKRFVFLAGYRQVGYSRSMMLGAFCACCTICHWSWLSVVENKNWRKLSWLESKFARKLLLHRSLFAVECPLGTCWSIEWAWLARKEKRTWVLSIFSIVFGCRLGSTVRLDWLGMSAAKRDTRSPRLAGFDARGG
jgi:hypothetical protein